MEDSNLSPQVADNKIFEGEGGSYYSWSSSKSPMLSVAKVGVGCLLLHPRGFALPHYADSSKVGYVLQGSCTAGMVFPNATEEKVLTISKGDVVPVPMGVVSWWFNGGETDLVMVFMGDTSKAYSPGEFTYFFLAGQLALCGGFSTELICKAYNMKEEEANKLVKSQTGLLIIKLEEGTIMPEPCKDTGEEMVVGIENAAPDISVESAGTLTTLTAAKLPFLERVGLSARLMKLDAGALCSPMYSADSAVQVTYVVRGGGRVQFVGMNGKCVLETKVKAGELYVVPRFFAAAMVADGKGMECFSVITSSQPVFGELNGNTSVWKALSPVVLQTSLGVTPEFAEIFTSKLTMKTILIPPTN